MHLRMHEIIEKCIYDVCFNAWNFSFFENAYIMYA